MSDTGSSGFTRSVTAAERIAQTGLNDRRTGGRLLGGGADQLLTPDERRRGGNARISGEVIEERVDRDGRTNRVKIRTPRGDVDVERDGNKPLPRKGQRVELEIRNDKPRHNTNTADANTITDGESVIIRTENTGRITTNTASPDSQNSQATRISATPIEVQIQSQAMTAQTSMQGIDPVSIAAKPMVDMNALMNMDTVVRLAAMDDASLTPLTQAAQPILSTINEGVFLNSDTVVASPNQGTVPALQTAVNLLSSRAGVSSAAGIVGAGDVVPTPLSPLAARENAGLPAQISADDVARDVMKNSLYAGGQSPLSFALGAAQGAQDANQMPLPLSETLSVRIRGAALPPALPSLPDFASDSVRNIPSSPFASAADAALLSDVRAGELQAVITGQTIDKLPTMSIFYARAESGQLYALQAPVDSLTAGTRLTLIPVVDGAPNALNVNAPMPLSVFIQPSANWASLNQAASALTASAAAAVVAQNMAAITPTPTNPVQLTPALMLFMAAVRGGDFSTWLGDKTMDAIRRSGRGDILSRVGHDSSLLGRLSSSPVSGDWNGMNVPLHVDGQYQKAMFYHRDYNEDGDGGKRGGRRHYTRFVFDLSLTNMGGVQLDGLLRRDRLDIVLRTQRQLSQTMQRDMRRVYAGAVVQANFTGDLSFQNDPRHWFSIKPDDRNFGVSA